jgi:ParB-like chromosome segregation protein Spo0J
MIQLIPLMQLHVRADQIATAGHRDFQYLRLLHSLEALGFLVPLVASQRAPGDYLVIDGARRYFCARELALETLPCVVRPALSEEEYQVLRLELFHRVEPLNSQEYAAWRKRFDSSLTNAAFRR